LTGSPAGAASGTLSGCDGIGCRRPREAHLVFFTVLALCALLTARLVYRYDLYEHEPLPLLGVAIALGAGAMRSAGLVEARVLALGPEPGPLRIAAAAAGVEEALKLLVVVLVSLLARREFVDPLDGVVYGSMAGLGAALEESVFYRQSSPLPGVFVPAAELVRLWAHVVLGGVVGFPLGFWRAAPRRAIPAALSGLALAALLHFGWDAVVLSVRDAPGAGPTLAGVALMVGSLALYGRLVVVASARSRTQFAPRSARGLWGWPFRRPGSP
jgi:RsiW-degrading membrane proteinase PrsW (M82 family)